MVRPQHRQNDFVGNLGLLRRLQREARRSFHFTLSGISLFGAENPFIICIGRRDAPKLSSLQQLLDRSQRSFVLRNRDGRAEERHPCVFSRRRIRQGFR